MPIQDIINRDDHEDMSDNEYNKVLKMLTGTLYVGTQEDILEEFAFSIKQFGKIDTITLEITPETISEEYYGALDISDWLDEVFDTFNRPEVQFEYNVYHGVHDLEIEGGYTSVEEAVTMLCEAFSHLIKNAPFPVVFQEFDEGHGFDRNKFPCINGTPKMKYPQDTEDIEIDEP